MWKSLKLLSESRGKPNAVVAGSRRWILDFYFPGPPPLVVEFLSRRNKRKFPEKLLKLLDLRKSKDARAILVFAPGALGFEDVQLALSFGIYSVMDGDQTSLKNAIKGLDVAEVNGALRERLLKTKSRGASLECREAILELLEKGWLTYKELAESLRWRFDPATVYAQLRTLQSKGAVKVLSRTRRGEGMFGLPNRVYPLRGDLSNPSKISYLTETINRFLEDKNRPVSYQEMANSLGVRRHIITSILGGLAKKGSVRKVEGGWALYKDQP
jgi:Mn-dependent DtxR family transcriptional regulator